MIKLERSRRNVLLLAACQALYMTGTSLMAATAPLVGHMLADDKLFATLPSAIHHTGIMTATIPASMLMRWIGRRTGFMTGTLIGATGAALAAWAIVEADFLLFCAGIYIVGCFNGFAVFYRFAAADTASESFRPTAISLVMAGGLFAAFLGPELAKATKDLFTPIVFAGCYLALIGVYILSMAIVSLVDIPRLSESERESSGRPLPEILRQPKCLAAILTAVAGYATMSMMMTSTPLAMVDCGFGFGDSALVIQMHIFAMFAPSFFTGHLIRRFGVARIVLCGIALNLAAIGCNLAGIGFANFSIALTALGVGWNFMFIGGTTLLTEVHTPAERGKVQGLNDFVVFGTVATSAFSSGGLLHLFGWNAVNLAGLPLMLMALAALAWMLRGRRDALA